MTQIDQPVNTPAAWSERARNQPASWDASGWSKESQQQRLVAVVAALAPRPFDSLLDWGCGTGALADHLPDDVFYVGFDTAEGMVARAALEHQDRVFQTWQPTDPFDLVACVGPFNLADRWSKQRTFHTLRHLWDTTECRCLVASLYAGDDPNCLSYTEAELAHIGQLLSCNVTIDRWRTNDVIFKVSR